MHLRSALLIAVAAAGSGGACADGETAHEDRSGHPGREVYERVCAACHDGVEERAPRLSILRAMSADDLGYALTEGTMALQGSALAPEERAAVVEYLASPLVSHDDWIAAIRCEGDRGVIDPTARGGMPMLGVDVTSPRYLTAEAAGISTADLPALEFAWAIAFPGVTMMRAGPVVVGSTVYYTAADTRKLLALDAETGCVKWAFDAAAPLRSGATVGELEGRPTLWFGDERGQVHAVDARTGASLWTVNARVDEGSGTITGAVVVHEGRVIVPLSASGVAEAADSTYECCEGRGAVTSLDAATGARLWSYVTMEEARYTGAVNSVGTRLRGPAGAPIWSTPTIDARRGRVYVTTGENTSLPATETSDAIIALDLETGRQLWVFQATPNDVYNRACTTGGPNCLRSEESTPRDWDFGGAAMLVTLSDGRDLLLAGQKSGHLWALDPDDGRLVWEQRRGQGGALGGNHWGIARDQARVFLTINDPGRRPGRVPGLHAFDIATGTPLWEQLVEPDCAEERRARLPDCDFNYGLSATPLVIDGAVVTAGLDGRIHIFAAETGALLYRYDTARPFDAINGVEGHGGSIDAHSIAAGAGMLFVGSGYAFFSQRQGNVLLAFRPPR